MRDNKWLEARMFELWENNFVDVPRLNKVVIKFGKKSRRQLGCIKWITHETRIIKRLLEVQPVAENSKSSIVVITGYFKDEAIPDQVVIATIAHEMCHYTHGFNSPLQQLYNHPHKGGVIRKEMTKRGLKDTYTNSRVWLKANWQNYLKNNASD